MRLPLLSRPATAAPGVHTLQTSRPELDANLNELRFKPSFISGYVAPGVDLDQVAAIIAARLPGIPMVLTSTAGELCGSGDRLYCEGGDHGTGWCCNCSTARSSARRKS